MGKNDGTATEHHASHRHRMTIAGGVLLLLVIGAAGFFFVFRAGADTPGTRMPDQGNRHIPELTAPHEPYNSDPPTSGPHVGYIAPWGIHTRPIPRELQVHNLEDGGVLVQYSCDCPDVVRTLTDLVRPYEKSVILAPYPEMKSRIALTAWTRIETMNDVDDARIKRFIDAYRGIDHHPDR
jgi:uncharacterized protein DUF3105